MDVLPNEPLPVGNERVEQVWPGLVEFGLLFVVMPLIWIVAVVWLLVRLLGDSMNLITGVVAGLSLAILGVVCWTQLRRDAGRRSGYWNGLLYPIPLRWAAIGHAFAAFFVAGILSWTQPTPSEKHAPFTVVADPAESKKASEEFANTPYNDDDKIRKKRGKLGITEDSNSGDGSPPIVNVILQNPVLSPPGEPRPDSPPSIPVYIPESSRDAPSRTEIIEKYGTSKPEMFGLGFFPIPIVLVLDILGIGGSTEYRQVTLETMSRTLDGQELDATARGKMVAQLAELTSEQIGAWIISAKKLIDGAPVDDRRKLAATTLVDEIASLAKSNQTELIPVAKAIADNIMQAAVASSTPLTVESVKNFVEQVRANPPPVLKAKIREALSKHPEWEAKIKAAWEVYDKPSDAQDILAN